MSLNDKQHQTETNEMDDFDGHVLSEQIIHKYRDPRTDVVASCPGRGRKSRSGSLSSGAEFIKNWGLKWYCKVI